MRSCFTHTWTRRALFPPGDTLCCQQEPDKAHVVPIITRAWALTDLACRVLEQAILGLSLSSLLNWLESNMERVGERSRPERVPQLAALWDQTEVYAPP